MKTIFYLLLLFSNLSVFAQSAKKEYLRDENGEPIEIDEYTAKLSEGYVYTVEENDTAYVARLVLREENGLLKPKQIQEIKDALKKLTGVTVSDNQTMILHFFAKPNKYSPGNCITNYVTNVSYKRFIKKNPQYQRFNITQHGFKYNSKHVWEDIHDIIYQYFKFGSACGNYMIIQPDGKFYRMMGEYFENDIPKKLEEMESK